MGTPNPTRDNVTPADAADHSAVIAGEESLVNRLIHNRKPVRERIDTVIVKTDEGPVTITVRGLSRGEYLTASKRHGDDEAAKEQFLASRALVDPQVTPEQVKIWQDVSGPTEINQVMMKVNELSGIESGADKS